MTATTLLALTLALLQDPASPGEVPLVLVGGDVVDVVSGETLRAHDVWILGQRIEAVVPTGTRPLVAGARRVDVGGRTLVPGLTDAHVHLDHEDELELYLSQGVTTVFNLRGVPRHLTWREEVARGKREGPTIYTAGDYVDGYPPYMEPMTSVADAADADAVVRAQAAAGYDFVKVYTQLQLDQLRAICAAADEVGLPVVGHASPNYALAELVAAGQANVAHGQELGRWYGDAEGSAALQDELVATLRGTGTTVTMNLSWTDGLIRQARDLEGLLEERIARALPAAILQPFRRANNRYVRDGVAWVADVEARFEREQRLARELHAAGVVLLAGTDASTAGVLPGSALLRELELLVQAGLTPLDALRAATLAPATFVAERVDADERFGRLAPGWRADVLVVAGDPLEDVTRLADVVGVVARGRWFARADLDRRLDRLTARAEELTPVVIELETAIATGELEFAREIFDALRAEQPDVVLFSQYVPFFIGYRYLYGDPSGHASALALYEMYAETYPEYHSAHHLLALARQATGDLEGAVESLEQALRIHPWHPDARTRLRELRGDADSD